MRKNKALLVLLPLLFALPILPSLISIPFSAISLPISMIGLIPALRNPAEFVRLLAFVVAMLLAGLYAVTYIISLCVTLGNKQISFVSFLPLIHIALFVVFFAIATWLESAYGVQS